MTWAFSWKINLYPNSGPYFVMAMNINERIQMPIKLLCGALVLRILLMTLYEADHHDLAFYANEKPTVELPAELQKRVEIRLVDLLEHDFLILEHAGLKVYRSK